MKPATMLSKALALLCVLALFAAPVALADAATTGSTATTAIDTSAVQDKGDAFSAPAVAPGQTNVFGWTVPDQTIQFTAFCSDGNFAPSSEDKVGIQNMHDYLLKYFNVDMTTTYADGDGTERLNLMLSSGDYPDVIFGGSMNDSMVTKFKDQGRLVDLTPYVDTDLADVKASIGDTYPLYLDADQKLWYVPNYIGGLADLPDNSLAIRWDEYQAIGAPPINTPDDYYNVVMQILAKDPTTPDGSQRYSLSLYNGGSPESFCGYWGLKNGWQIGADNSFTYWAFTDAGKEMSQWFNKFYLSGTMDPDAFSNNFDSWKTKFTNEQIVGCIGGWWISWNAGHEVWELTDPNLPADKRYVQVGMKAPDAAQAYVSGKSAYGWGYNTVITDKATDVEGILKFIDFQATIPGRQLINWGIPGGVATVQDPSVQFYDWTITSPTDWSFNPEQKQKLIDETYDYATEPVAGAANYPYALFVNMTPYDTNGGTWDIFPNQMWYDQNKWKQMMMQNLAGTSFDSTPMVLRNVDQDTAMLQQAVKDAWTQNWPNVVQAPDQTSFDAAWQTLQDALTGAGIDQYAKIMSDNYAANMAKLGQ